MEGVSGHLSSAGWAAKVLYFREQVIDASVMFDRVDRLAQLSVTP